MPEDKKKAPAKVAQPKKPTKAAAANTAVAKKVADVAAGKTAPTAAPKRSAIKPPYNYRLRSLVRFIVEAADEDSRKELRVQLRDLTTFAEIRDTITKLLSAEAYAQVVEEWFDAGVKGD